MCEHAQSGGSICVVRPDALTAIRGKMGDTCFATCKESTFAGAPSVTCSLFPLLKSGAACYSNDGVYCNPTAAACTPLEPIGGSCFDVNVCVKGAYCAGASIAAKGMCTADVSVGGDCSGSSAACGDSAYCDHNACHSRKVTGEACSHDQECASVPCDQGKCAGTAPVLASVCAGQT